MGNRSKKRNSRTEDKEFFMRVIKTDEMRVPLKIWATDYDTNAQEQMKVVASLPYVFKQVCLMPDAHLGYGINVGGVVATDGVISPNFVGVDIGCGMCAVNTGIFVPDEKALTKIRAQIQRDVPVGFNKHKVPQDRSLMPVGPQDFKDLFPIVFHEYENALLSLGTLGGGNHFIELQTDGSTLWTMIHSGSRNLGKQVADHYNKLAEDLNAKWHSRSAKDCAFLPVDSVEGLAYAREMQFCVDFALANRKLMMECVLDAIEKATGEVVDREIINIAHNYARLENHFGRNVWVHRKGATSARLGEVGIIPGSMGTKSYIVQGLGNRESFSSCSHGAGRKMGRKEAQRTLSLETEKAKMMGIVHGLKGIDNLDEAPGAYKDIDVVMTNQSDLVEIMVELSPLMSVKG